MVRSVIQRRNEKIMLESSYRSLPFWSWNDKLEKEELIKQVAWMDEKGIGGFFMHARAGLQTEYMSQEWMECIEVCAKEAKKRDMQAWLYDENGWPSGFAGGKLLENENNRDKYIELKEGSYDKEATVSYLLTEEELVRVYQKGNEEGRYLNLYLKTAVSTADILNPEVVEQFIELTHEKYKEWFGERFSEMIEGFFTDEPQYQRWGTPYTDMIAKHFEEKYGEDILDSLGLLFVEKKGYRRFRYRYWKGMQELMLHNFAEKVYHWCDNNHVKLTGHYVEEVTLGMQMMCCGGVMPFYEYEHIPGVDCLGRRSDNELPSIQVASAAAQLGKKQVLTETFGCCGWDVTPADLRRIAGFQYANGVNMLCHHLIPYTERGNRKYDHPAHYSEVNPWVRKEFETFNNYFTRLGYLLGAGKQCVNVAMLHPMRSAYFHYKRELEPEGFGVRDLDEALYDANKWMASHGVSFHYLDETLLAKYGYVKEGHIGCGKCEYEYLILPKVYTMDGSTERLLRKFVEQGGRVLLLDQKPTYVEADSFDYPYLISNCTMEEIMSAQPFQVTNWNTEIYATYRCMDEKKFLYIINASQTELYTQRFVFDKKVLSFIKVDLTDMSEKRVPLEITLKPGEDALLLISEEALDFEQKLQPYHLRFENASIVFQENAMPVDHISYSQDGKEFSQPWPCAALFQKLLKERYEGRIFFRYEFEVEVVPERIYLKAEANQEIHAWLNDTLLTDKLNVGESYENVYDISAQVRCGTNTYTVEVNWHEDESVYYALYGENVTESLRNCIVYDSELQPIQLIGQFGVYSRTDYRETEKAFIEWENFYIGKAPEKVSNLTVEGFPFLAGEVMLSQKVVFDTSDILLQIAGDYQMAEVTVNGVNKGVILFEKEMDISDVAVIGENDVQVRFWLSNRNLLGPHHWNGGKTENVSPWSFELYGTWEEDESREYHDSYDLKLFYEKI